MCLTSPPRRVGVLRQIHSGVPHWQKLPTLRKMIYAFAMTSQTAAYLPRDDAALSQASSPQGVLSTLPVSLAIAIGYASRKSPGIEHFVRDVVGGDVHRRCFYDTSPP
jgi:hypothetical protein